MRRLSREFNTCLGLYLRIERAHLLVEVTPAIQKLLYLKKKEGADHSRDKRILSIEKMYDTILRVHIEHNHVRRDGCHKRLLEQYHV